LQPQGALTGARAARELRAVTNILSLDRFKQRARAVSGPSTVFMVKVSMLT